MTLHVNLGEDSYDILIRRGCLQRAAEYLDLRRRVLIVTDDGVPEEYARQLASGCGQPVICRIPQGEENKTLQVCETLLRTMLNNQFTRKDCVAAVGGGICGDMAGFAAATYMRGIDFYNIPTTVLSQVDSSVGGKTAVNLDGIKNVVGAFYQPKKVLIDVDLLKTLPQRHISAGLAEALKMAVTFDEELFTMFEKNDPLQYMDRMQEIIERALRIKAAVVEQDEKEQGLRKVLNFGHTIGHGIESLCLDGSLYHGECVAIGMLPMCSEEIRQRLIPILKKLHLPTGCSLDPDRILEAMTHDKKAESDGITIVETDRIGTFTMWRAGKDILRARVSMTASGETK